MIIPYQCQKNGANLTFCTMKKNITFGLIAIYPLHSREERACVLRLTKKITQQQERHIYRLTLWCYISIINSLKTNDICLHYNILIWRRKLQDILLSYFATRS